MLQHQAAPASAQMISNGNGAVILSELSPDLEPNDAKKVLGDLISSANAFKTQPNTTWLLYSVHREHGSFTGCSWHLFCSQKWCWLRLDCGPCCGKNLSFSVYFHTSFYVAVRSLKISIVSKWLYTNLFYIYFCISNISVGDPRLVGLALICLL